jgi:hypothetical protein
VQKVLTRGGGWDLRRCGEGADPVGFDRDEGAAWTPEAMVSVANGCDSVAMCSGVRDAMRAERRNGVDGVDGVDDLLLMFSSDENGVWAISCGSK